MKCCSITISNLTPDVSRGGLFIEFVKVKTVCKQSRLKIKYFLKSHPTIDITKFNFCQFDHMRGFRGKSFLRRTCYQVIFYQVYSHESSKYFFFKSKHHLFLSPTYIITYHIAYHTMY